MEFLKNVFKSIFIGAGSIAPGVSGGALAIVLGLYEKIIHAINHFLKDIKKNGVFLLSIGIGAALGIVIFSAIQMALIKSYEMQTMFTFAGLVVGTIPTLFKTANKKGYSPKYLIPFGITLVIALLFSYLNNTSISDNLAVPEVLLNFETIVFLILIGVIMSGSLVIPGISGTVLLFLLGVYGLVLGSIASIKDVLTLGVGMEMIEALLNKLYILAPLGVGLVLGTIVFSKLMEFLLNRYYSITYYAILGFVIGSLPELVPGFSFNSTGIISVIFFLIATLASLQINKLVKE